MKYLTDMAKAISASVNSQELRNRGRAHREDIHAELQDLSDDDVLVLVEQLFGRDFIRSEDFYERLTDVHRYVGYEPPSYALVGRVWAKAVNLLAEDRKRELLSALLNNERRGFWTAIRCFPVFCESAVLPPRYAAGWFHDLAERIAGDLAGGEFYVGITKYAEEFPESAVITFEQYMCEELDSFRVHIAAILLGTARAKGMHGDLNPSTVKTWDRRLQRSANLQWRLIYHKSLVSSFNLTAISVAQLRAKLATMLKGTEEEVSEAFDVVGRCLRKDKSDEKFIRFALRWYGRNASPQIPDLAKYHLLDSLWLLCSSDELKDKASTVRSANDLVVAIQPVPGGHRGIWGNIERYLVTILGYDWDYFERLFARLVKDNPDGILQQFKEGGFLKSELPSAQSEGLATKLLLSASRDEWEVGKSIFQDTGLETLSHEVLAAASEIQLELALLQSIRSPFLAHKTYPSGQLHLFLLTDFATIPGGGAQWLILMARQRRRRAEGRSGRSICGNGRRAA